MKTVAGVAGAAAVLLGIWWALGGGGSPETSVLDPSSSGAGPVTTFELPDDAELPADPAEDETLPSDGTAMLLIERELGLGGLGQVTLGADFTIQIENDMVFATTESEGTLVVVGVGATGISHTTNGTMPVIYEVKGLFYPVFCTLELTVTETVRNSQMSAENTLLGALPPDPQAEDTVTTFEVAFDQQSLDFFVIPGSGDVASFTLYDVVLPDSAGCNFSG